MSWELSGNQYTNPPTDFLGTVDSEPLVIKTNAAERLRITQDGNVGIGTTQPSEKLTVDPQGRGGIIIGNSSTGQGGFTSLLLEISAASGGYARLQAIKSSGAEWGDLTINPSGGNVGIGTELPASPLHIVNGTSANITLERTGALAHKSIIYDDGNLHVEGMGQNTWINQLTKANLLLNVGGGNVGIGTTSPQAKLDVSGDILVAGDVLLTGADCAEEFDVAEAADFEPGTVMVIDQNEFLQQSHQAYDKRVAGVISGAGDYQPGLILDRKQSQGGKRAPVALVGKAYCKVDARYAPIEVGDLLTTSPTPGHAMKAEDAHKAFGSVIGKALRPLQAGQGMIPVLIVLQ